MDVSARLRVEPEVERNLNGYLITAFHHRVRSQMLRDSRLAYEGLLCELEEKHEPRAPDWAKALETKLALKFLVSYLPHQTKHMLNYRTFRFFLERDCAICRNHRSAGKIQVSLWSPKGI